MLIVYIVHYHVSVHSWRFSLYDFDMVFILSENKYWNGWLVHFFFTSELGCFIPTTHSAWLPGWRQLVLSSWIISIPPYSFVFCGFIKLSFPDGASWSYEGHPPLSKLLNLVDRFHHMNAWCADRWFRQVVLSEMLGINSCELVFILKTLKLNYWHVLS